MLRIIGTGWGVLAANVLLAGPLLVPARAGEPAGTRDPVRQLLEDGWDAPLDQQKKLDAWFAQLPLSVRAESRPNYAYALLLIKQRRYTEAAKVVDDLVARDGRDVAAWRAKIWLAMLTKRYAQAAPDMVRLAELLRTQAGAAPPDELSLAAAQDLGTDVGYFEGPGESAIAPQVRDGTRDKVLAQLPPPLKDEFTKARQRVRETFATLKDQRKDAEQQARQEAAEQRDEKLQDVKEARERLTQQRDELKEQGEKLREDLRYEVDRLVAAERPLVAELAGLQVSLATTARQLADVRRDIAGVEALLPKERDSPRREPLLREIRRLQFIEDQIVARLTELQRQAVVLNTRLVDVRGQQAALQAGAGAEMQRAGEKLSNLERQKRLTDAAEGKARSAKSDARRTGHLTARRPRSRPTPRSPWMKSEPGCWPSRDEACAGRVFWKSTFQA